MSRLKDQSFMTDGEIQFFFEKEGAYRSSNDTYLIVKKDTVTQIITSTLAGQDSRWYDQCLDLASKSTCCLCGKNPSGDTTSMALVVIKPTQNIVAHWGVCDECKTMSEGQSPIRIRYRAWKAMIENKIKNENLVIVGNDLCRMKDALP